MEKTRKLKSIFNFQLSTEIRRATWRVTVKYDNVVMKVLLFILFFYILKH